jgi:hypothetical protein
VWTGSFWKETLERALKSSAQFVIFYLVGANTPTDSPINFFDAAFGWGDLLGFAASGLILSVLTSIVSAPIGPGGTPSLVESKARND